MVVRMRSNSSHTGNRRSHIKLSKPALTRDQNGALSLRHRVSPISGMYKGKQVLDLTKKLTKKAKKIEETEKK
ncbi:MAG TPA: 50S ribosomal protein L32 [Candidatus Paceibacterota bacterium]|nr:50S ribosomal protein L32 [Candidatus Paceibacterota bacterium]HRZ34498.1 50S ribosomal protein L32 [Candidatus Paceibacterota bacterium]